MDDAAKRISADANSFVVGVFDGERLVGAAGFFRSKGIKERHKGRIWGVYVSRSARGKGAARRMLRVLLDRAIAMDGLEQIQLAIGDTPGDRCEAVPVAGL
jgi:ribosomal protein S18 acetylase RimI-like enzyme